MIFFLSIAVRNSYFELDSTLGESSRLIIASWGIVEALCIYVAVQYLLGKIRNRGIDPYAAKLEEKIEKLENDLSSAHYSLIMQNLGEKSSSNHWI